MKTAGRPKKQMEPKEFKKLCELQCTLMEVAAFFDVSESTVRRRCMEWFGEDFETVFKRLSAGGRQSLRRKQFDVAMEGSVPMLIWLGKQMLQQKDNAQPATEELTIPTPLYVVKGKEPA